MTQWANESMFWRLWLRSLTVKRPQAALAILSVGVGAALAAMLLNLYGDARRKMTQEFRRYGANVIVAPAYPEPGGRPNISDAQAAGLSSSETIAGVMDEDVVNRVAALRNLQNGLAAVPLLNVVVRVKCRAPAPRLAEFEDVVAVGTDFAALRNLNPSWRVESRAEEGPSCAVGTHLASRLRLGPGDTVELQAMNQPPSGGEPLRGVFRISSVLSTGAFEDEQVFLPLAALQELASLSGKISLVEVSVPGETAEVERLVGELGRSLPGVDVRPVRQIVYSSGKVLDTIRWLVVSLTAVILTIIALCLTATMTAIVLERRKDIAVMKALGASDRLVMKLFLTEGAGLGFLGGLAGFGLGVELAREAARRLFDVNLSLTWWTFPAVSLASVLLVMVAAFFPVRIVRGVEPATVLKGE